MVRRTGGDNLSLQHQLYPHDDVKFVVSPNDHQSLRPLRGLVQLSS